MVKFKYIFLLVALVACFAACKKSTNVDEYDPTPQFKADTAAIRTFITTNNIPALKDSYGIFYQIIEPGTGSVTYNAATKVTTSYEGKLLNGTKFDSSTSATFALGQVIPGWQIGIQKIQKGGKIRLIIPSYYGYGNSAAGSIPANSILDFTISLTDVQ
ncbi:FKBP-type peptidyl-prolyl cis-trans isomerase [Pedobacter sp.]|uniref:FKBP-type peptidyl-prolyl cis-trans isomerase n=1 Tax=Pedobacter sp. TaxID=1411316 RepID=UPI003BAB63AC